MLYIYMKHNIDAHAQTDALIEYPDYKPSHNNTDTGEGRSGKVEVFNLFYIFHHFLRHL